MSDLQGGESSPGWAVVVSKPMCEMLAEKTIRSSGYRVFLPMYKKALTGNDKRAGEKRRGKILTRPLFTGYLFVELWPDQDFVVSRFVGVSRLLHQRPSGGVPGKLKLVSGELIEAIRDACDAGVFDKGPISTRLNAEVGSAVRPTEGPFASFLGRISEIDDDRTRIVVLMEIFGRTTPVTFDNPAALEVIDESDDAAVAA